MELEWREMKLAQLYRKYKVLIYSLESLYVIIVHVSAVLDSDWLVMVLKCQKHLKKN